MQNLIIWEPFDYILLFILAFLPMLYKLLFWLYTIQLKEYRLDRFGEYLRTKQWKSALFNIFFIIEIFLLFYYIIIWWIYLYWNAYNIAFWWIWYNIMFYYLLILNIFVIWKILRKRILKPKFTSRLIILLFLFAVWWVIDLYLFYKFNLWDFTYLYILGIFLVMPLIIFFYNFLSLPLVNYKKNKQINSAINKSEKINNLIKIWITGSYGKSSVKEFLSSILEQTSPLLDKEGQGVVLKTPENQNTEMSVSSLILNKLTDKYKYFVAEMWAYKRWEISLLWKIVNHKYWFLTAIWNQHIWLFWNQENIVLWKFEIYESVFKNNWFLYVNWDCEEINKYLEYSKLEWNIIKYWINLENNLNAFSEIILVKNNKTKFNFSYKNIKTEFEIDLIWEHNVVNITWVITCCIDLWLEVEDIKKYIKKLKTPENTKTIIENWENILIDDTYNLSEAGLQSGLELFKNYSPHPNPPLTGEGTLDKILVLDDILELWKEAEKIHFNIWKNISEKKICDKVLFCWVNYKESFIKWLKEWWFEEEDILNNLESIWEKNVILFEWRWAKKYLDK